MAVESMSETLVRYAIWTANQAHQRQVVCPLTPPPGFYHLEPELMHCQHSWAIPLPCHQLFPKFHLDLVHDPYLCHVAIYSTHSIWIYSNICPLLPGSSSIFNDWGLAYVFKCKDSPKSSPLLSVLHWDTHVIGIWVHFMADDKLYLHTQIWLGPNTSCVGQIYHWEIHTHGEPMTNR